MIASLAIMLAVLASLGPIVAFFAVSSTSYAFIMLLNVAVYALSGVLGLAFLLQTLHRISVAQLELPADIPAESTPATGGSGALDQLKGQVLSPHVWTIFRIWVIVFAVVGAQMAWVLRPFVGHPNKPFEWFRERGGNFFETVWRLFTGLLGWQSS